MTDQQWQAELAADLDGTNWVVEWSSASSEHPMCMADAHNYLTQKSRPIELSRDAFPTPETRKIEALRQLATLTPWGSSAAGGMKRLPGARLDLGIWPWVRGPVRYYGRIIPESSIVNGWISMNGPELWRCDHFHESSEQAYCCAEDELLRRVET